MTAQETIKIARLEVKVVDIDKKVDDMDKRVDKKMDTIISKLDALDGKYITRLEALAVSAAVSFILILVGLYFSGRS